MRYALTVLLISGLVSTFMAPLAASSGNPQHTGTAAAGRSVAIVERPKGEAASTLIMSEPFQFYKNEVIVQAKLDGEGPFRMLLSTGASTTVVDLSLARRLKLALGTLPPAPAGITAAPGLPTQYTATIQEVGLGSYTTRNIASTVFDLTALNKRFGMNIDGVLGYACLEGQVVQLDYPGRTLRIFASSPYGLNEPSGTASTSVMTFGYYDGLIVNDAFVGADQVVTCIDTGDPDSFSLTQPAVTGLSLDGVVASATPTAAAGYNESGQAKTGTLSAIKVGSFTVSNPKVTFWPESNRHTGADWSLAVGNGFLQDYVVTIDDKDALVVLKRAG